MMDDNFIKYMLFIALISGCLVGGLILIILKLKKRNTKTSKVKYDEINGGSVSAFFDKGNNITIIPYVKDKFGVGRATTNSLPLGYPYTPEKLGQALRASMNSCISGIPSTDKELMASLKYNSWNEFSQGKRNISVHFQDGYGIVFNTTIRRYDGSYQFNYTGFDRIAKSDATNKELGEMLLNLLPRCRS